MLTFINILLALLGLILLIFLTKKFLKTPHKIIKYIYFIFFIISFRILSLNIENFNSKKTLGIFYMILSFALIKFIDILINESYYNRKKNIEIPHLIRNIILVISLTISFFYILKNYFSVNLTSILTTSAILSAIIGLAVQDLLTTFIAGLVLTSDKSLEIGDTVIIQDTIGKVIDTNWRITKLQKAGGGVVSIPNNLVIKELTLNYGKKSNIIITIKISASYDSSPNKVKDLLLQIAHNNTLLLKEPQPFVIISGYGDSAINYELKACIYDEFLRKTVIETELYTSIWYAFRREGIKIPYSIREILTPKDLEEKSKEFPISYFQKVEFFSTLNEETINELQSITKIKTYGKDEFIFLQNDFGDSFFIIKKGEVSVIVDEKQLTCLFDGSFFGEMSLLTGKPRSASVKALKETELFVIEKEDFKGLIQKNQNLFDNVLTFLTKREEEQQIFKKEINNNSIKSDTKENIKNQIFRKLVKFFEI